MRNVQMYSIHRVAVFKYKKLHIPRIHIITAFQYMMSCEKISY